MQKTGAGQYAYSTTTTINTTTGLSPQSASLQFNARYVYDEQGRLLGEYSPEGKLISETIWFDDLPVATIRPKGSSAQLPLGVAGTGTTTANNAGSNTPANPVNIDVFYLHPDHLGTPRVATRSVAVANATTGPNAVNKAVWRHESDPFGTSLGASAPNENPQNITGTQTQIKPGSMRLDNAFAGQLRDRESGKSQNYFRDYDSGLGRYTTFDPIGLAGGLNPYGYVGQRPIKKIDPKGLRSIPPTDGPEQPVSICVGPVDSIPGRPDWHQFLCVDGNKCGGLGRGDNGLPPIAGVISAPGIPSSDSYSSQKCVPVLYSNECFENCIKRKLGGPRPDYTWIGWIGIPGQQCRQFAQGIVTSCFQECFGK